MWEAMALKITDFNPRPREEGDLFLSPSALL